LKLIEAIFFCREVGKAFFEFNKKEKAGREIAKAI
jgi:hypothetical protein